MRLAYGLEVCAPSYWPSDDVLLIMKEAPQRMANSRSGDALLDRVMRILGALERDPVLSPGELAEAAELPRTTAYRLITDLVERGMLARTAVGDIELGQRLWRSLSTPCSPAPCATLPCPSCRTSTTSCSRPRSWLCWTARMC
ncbi:helix-turn-helix domain-containing protein [Nesterenkonia pannonica]|uniref:helix-turn-helix domain-containing protein n=1 Tax=Nesterenkonia pannonica TaxID=1548602 RepID=UPI002164EA10|nr:helix-turn-helix domain-containing protein [Nesterenkonia pannonica]